MWKNTTFPEIKKRAKKLGATIYFAGESGVRSDYDSGRTWALIGQTPVVESTGARFSVNMIAAIDTRGRMSFMTTKKTVHSERVCEFLRRLMHDNKSPVFLIWDGPPTHKSKKLIVIAAHAVPWTAWFLELLRNDGFKAHFGEGPGIFHSVASMVGSRG